MKLVRRADVGPFDFDGLEIRDLTATLAESSASVAHIEVSPGIEHQKARSTLSDKYYICLHGEIQFLVDGEPADLAAGDLLIVERGDWFSYGNPGPEPAHLLLVHVPPFDLEYEEFAGEPDAP
jgi:mannose-6-phosphate isomerase-like protein (cupin superfamily)